MFSFSQSQTQGQEEVISLSTIIRRRLLPRYMHWATKGTLAILDQAFFAGTHFILNVLLARWFTSTEYGIFALAYSVFVLLASLHSATFVEPMLVFGAGKYLGRLPEYLYILLRGHFLVLCPISVLMIAFALTIRNLSSSSVGHAFMALAITAPLILVLWMVRRAFYVDLQPGWAVLGAVLYLVVLLALLSEVRSFGKLSTITALAIMSVAALVATGCLLHRLRPRRILSANSLGSWDVARSHWHYGRWSVAAAAAGWIPLNIYYLLLPVRFGLEGAAALRALMNLINPVLHVLVALGSLLLPTLVRNRDVGGKKKMNRTMIVSLIVFLLGSSIFAVCLWAFRAQAFQVFYGDKYRQVDSLPLLLLLLSLLAACIVAVLGTALMALEHPEKNFWSYVASSVTAIAVGVPLAALRGVQGAAGGIVLAGLTSASFMYYFYRQVGVTETPLLAPSHGCLRDDEDKRAAVATD